MRPALLTTLAAGVLGCQRYVPPPRAEKPGIILSVEYPNAAGGGAPGRTLIHARNESGGTVKAVRDFTQARLIDQYGFVIREAGGAEVRQTRPFPGGPPMAPTEKDYVVLRPGEAGTLELWPGSVAQAYDLKPGRLYFIEIRVRFEGLAEQVTLVAPFGYTEARKE